MPCILTSDQVQAYQEDGYVIAREVFTPAEADLLRRAMEEDPKVSAHSLIRPDTEGGGTRISLWRDQHFRLRPSRICIEVGEATS